MVRFRSPGVSGNRVSFTDAIRGELSMDDNRNDAVILKSSATEPRLPTYHFAHAVDDHLMRVNLVIRGEEWISSVPLHLQPVRRPRASSGCSTRTSRRPDEAGRQQPPQAVQAP